MNYLSIIAYCLLAISCCSCQKKDVEGFKEDQLNISISKPLEAQIFHKGDTVFIRAAARYVSQLHGYSIQITDKANNATYLDIDQHLHDSSFDITTYWVDTLSTAANLTLKLTVEADHDGHEGSKIVNFTNQL